MAVSNLLALIDDITTVLDDVAVLTKVATQKTAGVLGDDLALNAQQVAGVRADRELPVVWAVAKGSLVNKAILVPVALAVSALAPWAVMPLLMVGGVYLCYEGFEKLAHRFLAERGEDAAQRAALTQALTNPSVDMAVLERDKIRGAVRTDFVLSAEIIAITLGAVAGATFATRAAVLSGIAVLMTVGVYGIVAAIVKLDDFGLWLLQRRGSAAVLGRAILAVAPWLMKGLSIAGTAAMFLVGGGILVHGLPALDHAIAGAAATFDGLAQSTAALAANAMVGLAAGALALALVALIGRWRGQRPIATD